MSCNAQGVKPGEASPDLEECPSGLRGTLGKRVWCEQRHREFESHFFRWVGLVLQGQVLFVIHEPN